MLDFSYVKTERDKAKRFSESIADAATNQRRLFDEDPNQCIGEDPLAGDETGPASSSTRLISDGSRKVCLLMFGQQVITLDGARLGQAKDLSERKMGILMSSISLPAKSVSKLAGAITKGIPGDRRTETLHVKRMGDTFLPVDPSSGKVIPDMKYTRQKGWEHA